MEDAVHGENPALICCKAQGRLVGRDPFVIPYDSAASTPGRGSWGWMAGSPLRGGGQRVHPVPDQGWGTLRGWDCEGRAQPRRDKLTPSWLDLGWRHGGSPSAPPERCLLDVRVRGGAERGEKGGRRTGWGVPGAGQALAAALHGDREGTRGTWGFTGGLGSLPALPLVPVKRIIPGRAAAARTLCWAPVGAGDLWSARGLRGRCVEPPVTRDYHGWKWLCWAGAGGTWPVWGTSPAPGTVRCSLRDVASPPAVSKQLWIIIIFF